MKIITGDAVYVQKNDIIYLNSSDMPIPASILLKLFDSNVVLINDNNRYEFIKYEAKDEIDFFKNIDWIIDYYSVKDLSEEEITLMAHNIIDERNAIAKRFNEMSDEDKSKNTNLLTQCDLLEYKMYSLRDIFLFKKGNISMTLPDGIEYPTEYVKEKGIKKLLKRVKKKFL